MDLSKMSNDKKLDLCRHYFKAGFALLPFVWAVNAVWFFNEAFKRDQYDEQPQIKRYVIYSAIGSILWSIIIAIWIIVFQVYRVSWGAIGDNLSFIIPFGTP
ncbi:Presenilin enhancer-2 subunit of gamma secretase [Popillia japonica]|uniref:Gamma-secretase subunit PEN-2 n=1 Tax=Popillia japonica TaxID=7064 RepID=A0AAW1N567_POPJA